MTRDTSQDRPSTASMLGELEQLATDIAILSRIRAGMGEADDALLIGQVIAHLEWTLEELTRRPGMLSDPLPWWTQWEAAKAV